MTTRENSPNWGYFTIVPNPRFFRYSFNFIYGTYSSVSFPTGYPTHYFQQLVRPTVPGNSGYPAPDSDNANNVNEKPRKIVITGDSLLYQMNIHKMKVNNNLNSKVDKERRHYQWVCCSLYELCGKAQ